MLNIKEINIRDLVVCGWGILWIVAIGFATAFTGMYSTLTITLQVLLMSVFAAIILIDGFNKKFHNWLNRNVYEKK